MYLYKYICTVSVSISIYVSIYAAVSNGKWKMEAQDFPSSVYRLLIMEMEVRRLAVCLRTTSGRLNLSIDAFSKLVNNFC